MKYLLCCLMLTCLNATTAQTVDSMAIKQVDSLILVSRSHADKRDFAQALEVSQIAINYVLDHIGPVSLSYGLCCNNHGRIYAMQGDFRTAEKWLLDGAHAFEQSNGKDRAEYAYCMYLLANLYHNLSNYQKAESACLASKAIREKLVGAQHPDYLATLNLLSMIYTSTSQFEMAELAALEAISAWKSINGTNRPDYLMQLNNLAIIYKSIGQYEKAVSIFSEVMLLRERLLGKNHPSYATSVHNLGSIYYHMGHFDQAEKFLLLGKDMREKILGRDHAEFGQSLTNLAALYVQMGNYDKALPLYKEIVTMYEKRFGQENADYALSLYNLGVAYEKMGDYFQSILIKTQAAEIRKKVLGKGHMSYGESVNSLAMSYMGMNDFVHAEPLLLEAEVNRRESLGDQHPAYAETLTNLGLLFLQKGDYIKSKDYFFKANQINELHFGKQHPATISGLLNLARACEVQGNFNLSESLLSEYAALEQERLSKSVQFLSEQELTRYIALFQKNGYFLGTFILDRVQMQQTNENVQINGLFYNHALFNKGFLLTAAATLNSLSTSTFDANEISLRLKGYRRRLAIEYSKPLKDRISVHELEEKCNAAEKELANTVSGYRGHTSQVSWQEVRSHLKKDEAAIEFIHFYANFPDQMDSVVYAALLLLPESKQPIFIPLVDEQELQDQIKMNDRRKSVFVNALYEWSERHVVQSTTNSPGLIKLGKKKKSLYELIWDKIEAAGLKNVRTIYYAPSGLFHRLNMGAIAINGEQLLSDQYQLIAVNSTRQIVASVYDSVYTIGNNAVVYGGIQFEADTTQIIPFDESDLTFSATRSLAAVLEDSTLRGGTWQYLHWTQKEAEVISKTLSKGGLKSEHRSGIIATEENFKALGQSNNVSPRVLHIATHGFFFPDPAQETAASPEDVSVFKWSDNPMIRSGLILSGGNYAWQNGKPVSPEKEDGILTAYEISQMNLSNTELVVLSACETGLGDIQGNEGVYGLQRAFKIAGAKYLIMSLWQVPDRETMEFMTTFYKNWLEGKMTIPDAYRKTQGEMREGFYDVFSWAAFVLVE